MLKLFLFFLAAHAKLLVSGQDYSTVCTVNSCPLSECVDTSASPFAVPKPFICICRRARFGEAGYEDCTPGFTPLGISPLENGTKIKNPDYDWEAIPDANFATNIATAVPHEARLNQPVGGWVGNIDDTEYVQVDIGFPAHIWMIATQGKHNSALDVAVLTYYVDYGLGEATLERFNDTGGNRIFEVSADVKNDDVYYNFLGDTGVTAQVLRIVPVTSKTFKSLRMEIYGNKTFDECSVDTLNSCDKVEPGVALCTDTAAAYTCQCPEGSVDVNKNGFECTLTDECTETRPEFKHNCSSFATCEDTPAAFTCTCIKGYQGDGYYCEDINECELDIPPTNPTCDSPSRAFCNNTDGAHECNCKPGFKGDGKKCKDINECRKGTHACHPNAECKNSIGFYICECRPGYKGNGYECENINECEQHPCSEHATCTDLDPEYECRCKAGFLGSGLLCMDINECSNNPCKAGEKCINTPGAYLCMCPEVMPLQVEYDSREFTVRHILDDVLDNLKDETPGNWRFSFDYHAQKVRTIANILNLTYNFHFKEVRDSFFISKTVGDHFSVELYDFRCTDVANVSFPNVCHSQYDGTRFNWFTDVVNIWLAKKDMLIRPFDSWATPPPYALGRDVTTPVPDIYVPTTSYILINGTNTTVTEPPPTDPPSFTKCGGLIRANISDPDLYHHEKHGEFESPKVSDTNPNYPPRSRCTWTIIVPEPYDIYVEFDEDNFELEHNKGCIYDYVVVKDENDKELKKYCGNKHTNHLVPIKSRQKISVTFFSDKNIQYTGFKTKWRVLYPRASLACIVYNQHASLPKNLVEKWQDSFEQDNPREFVPVSRLMACYQYPKCISPTRPGPIVYTFEHFREDRNDKKCIRWDLTATATSYSEDICIKVKTNKTHTMCECRKWGIVGVLGRATVVREKRTFGIFELGINCFFSGLMVTLSLVVATLYLFLKDQWGAAVIEVLSRREFDSGRMIQLHIMVSALLMEILFMAINFSVTGESGKCHVLAIMFFYALQTVFFWLFIYTIFLQSRVREVFDTDKYNSYKIYLFVGYVIPLVVTFTVTGLDFKEEVDETLCWYLFEGTSVWGFSSVIITLGVGTLLLLADVVLEARHLEDGIILQEKCIKTMFTTFFVLLTSLFGTLAIQTRTYGWQYLFSICNMLQGFSIVILYCTLRREDPIIKANQIGPKPDTKDEAELGDNEEIEGKFLDMSPCESESEEELEIAKMPPTPVYKPRSVVVVVEQEEEEKPEEEEEVDMVDEPIIDTPSSDDEIDFRHQDGDDYIIN